MAYSVLVACWVDSETRSLESSLLALSEFSESDVISLDESLNKFGKTASEDSLNENVKDYFSKSELSPLEITSVRQDYNLATCLFKDSSR